MTREEAIEVYNGLINQKIREAFEFFVPELRESEDERMMREFNDWLCEEMTDLTNDCRDEKDRRTLNMLCYVLKKVDAYLEKQKEQKSNIEKFEDISTVLLVKKEIERRIETWQKSRKEALALECNTLADDAAVRIEELYSLISFLGTIRCGTNEKQKEQKPILEVFGFKVGDAVRLKDGDGRKHIIKSFEEIEGVHGPDFYRAIFEDDTASDHIIPGDEYPNGFFTCMVKLDEQKEQKPEERFEEAGEKYQVEWGEEDEKIITRLIDYFESFRIVGVTTKWEGLDIQEVITLLKSLRPSWKPSKEQMNALNALNCLGDFSYVSQQKQLISLYNDLKKLKGGVAPIEGY